MTGLFLIYPEAVKMLRNAGCSVYHGYDGAGIGPIIAEHGTHRRYFQRGKEGMYSRLEIRAFLDFLHAQPRRD